MNACAYRVSQKMCNSFAYCNAIFMNCTIFWDTKQCILYIELLSHFTYDMAVDMSLPNIVKRNAKTFNR